MDLGIQFKFQVLIPQNQREPSLKQNYGRALSVENTKKHQNEWE